MRLIHKLLSLLLMTEASAFVTFALSSVRKQTGTIASPFSSSSSSFSNSAVYLFRGANNPQRETDVEIQSPSMNSRKITASIEVDDSVTA